MPTLTCLVWLFKYISIPRVLLSFFLSTGDASQTPTQGVEVYLTVTARAQDLHQHQKDNYKNKNLSIFHNIWVMWWSCTV
jgi:hypothetical protein